MPQSFRSNARSVAETPIANPSDAEDAQSLYQFQFGAYGDTVVYVWADSDESAFEIAVEWLDDHAPGLLVDVTLDDLKEAAEDQGIAWKDTWPVLQGGVPDHRQVRFRCYFSPARGEDNGYGYAVKIAGIDNSYPSRFDAWMVVEPPDVKRFRETAKQDWILTKARKGMKPLAELKRWIAAVQPEQFYARWPTRANDDSMQIWYQPGATAAQVPNARHRKNGRRVYDYQTGQPLTGAASGGLALESAAAGPQGVVSAYLDERKVWQYVHPEDAPGLARRGYLVKSVYVD